MDNLAPSAPFNVHMPQANLLVWDPVPDEDFNYYSVYTSETEDFASYEIFGTMFRLEGSNFQFALLAIIVLASMSACMEFSPRPAA